MKQKFVTLLVRTTCQMRSSYSNGMIQLIDPLFSMPSREELTTHHEWIFPLAEHYLDHRFNLLGSGWINVFFGMKAKGLESISFQPLEKCPELDKNGQWLSAQINPSNVKYAREVWRTLMNVNSNYIPIDWQIAFKTGYRWSSKDWNTEMRKDLPLGVDIKEPWELSRMQHLPVLAYAYSLSGRQAQYLEEFQCQILDFISQNPPGFGVNWACPMDIAIRMVNWLVAYDFFRTENVTFNPEFKQILTRSIYDHAQFIFRFREFSPIENNNHYLSNLCGLIFAAAYLPDNPSSRKWLKLALPAFIKEVEHQFNPDGSNFEGSVSYHRLSAEMVTYTVGVIQRMRHKGGDLWQSLISDQEIRLLMMTLKKVAEFSMDVTNPAGRVWQIGDNDNGRFLKLQPLFLVKKERVNPSKKSAKESFAVENTLNHQPLVAGINAILQKECLSGFYEDNALDYCVMQSVLDGAGSPMTLSDDLDGSRSDEFPEKVPEIDLSGWNKVVFTFPAGGLKEKLHVKAYADFGLYIFKSNRIHLVVRCGGRGRCKKAGHMHEDQFSICLCVDGKEYISDPGTYLYTPTPPLRNYYRSASAHFVPSDLCVTESAYQDRPVFSPPQGEEKKCLVLTVDQFVGGNLDGDPEVVLQIEDGKFCLYSKRGSYPKLDEVPEIPFSSGYGIKEGE